MEWNLGGANFLISNSRPFVAAKPAFKAETHGLEGGHKLGKLNVERGEVGGLMGIVYALHVFVVSCLWFVVCR